MPFPEIDKAAPSRESCRQPMCPGVTRRASPLLHGSISRECHHETTRRTPADARLSLRFPEPRSPRTPRHRPPRARLPPAPRKRSAVRRQPFSCGKAAPWGATSPARTDSPCTSPMGTPSPIRAPAPVIAPSPGFPSPPPSRCHSRQAFRASSRCSIGRMAPPSSPTTECLSIPITSMTRPAPRWAMASAPSGGWRHPAIRSAFRPRPWHRPRSIWAPRAPPATSPSRCGNSSSSRQPSPLAPESNTPSRSPISAPASTSSCIEAAGAQGAPLATDEGEASVTTIAPGESATLIVTFTDTGNFQLASHAATDYEQGMALNITVV